ncbi:MAG: hypothetical protein P4L92_03440 [Rudaea sp.]|nr:hypothetical protein [Rudaea sp.]
MNPVDSAPASLPQDSTPEPASLSNLAHGTTDYVRAWSSLVASESRLARISATRLVFACLFIPALGLGICIALDAFLVTLLNRWLHDWSSCIAIVLCADIAVLCALLLAMRRWWRNLSMPRSRQALTHLLGRMT